MSGNNRYTLNRYVSALWVVLGMSLLCDLVTLGAEPSPPSTPPSRRQLQDIDELNLEKLLQSEISLASGKTQSVEDAPGIVSVVNAETIRRLGARTLQDVLDIIPGFEVWTDNLGRKRIIVRGLPATGGENVLILFNGHRLNEAITGGATAINLDIPVDNLQRIEIIRGPGSALFGTNAFAGVINLIPYHADSFTGVRAAAAYGSFATQDYHILGGHRIGDLRISGFMQYRDTNGPRLHVTADRQSAIDLEPFNAFFPPASRAPGQTDDDRRSVDANAQLTYNGFTLNARVKDERSGGYIGLTDRLSDSTLEQRQIGVDTSYQQAVGKQATLLARFSFTQNESQQHLELLPPGALDIQSRPLPDGISAEFDSNSRRFNGDVVFHYLLATQHRLTLGASLAHETTFDLHGQANVSNPPSGLTNRVKRDIVSVWLQDIWTPLPELEITLGIRYDHFSDFGQTLDPRVGAVWRFAKPFYLKLLYGSAFRAPSFFELEFSADKVLPDASFIGNPDLRATTLQAIEVALGYTQSQMRISANYFITFVRDFIELAPMPENPGGSLQFTNHRDMDIQGLEFELQASWQDHTFFLNYTYQYAIDKATHERVPEVPKYLANLGTSLALGPYVRLTPTLLIRDRRPRTSGDARREAASYAVVNTTVLVRNLFQGLELSATVSNLLDTRYADPALPNTVPDDYPRPGRSVWIKATYTF